MPALHLIHKDDPTLAQITPVARRANVYRSGNWILAEKTATALIGGRIYFHRKQRERSFYGGTITAFDMIKEGKDEGRVIFTFESLLSGIRVGVIF